MANYVPDDEISGYVGLAHRSPGLALALTAALLSLAGIPPFVGFFAKLYLFLAAIRADSRSGLQLLVIWALIMSAVSLYYYGRVIHTMWMRDAVEPGNGRPASFSQGLALAASLAGVLALRHPGRALPVGRPERRDRLRRPLTLAGSPHAAGER